MFRTGVLTCHRYRNGTSSVFVDDFANFLHVFVSAVCGGTTWTITILNRNFPTFECRKPLKSLHFPVASSTNAVLSILRVSDADFSILK
jgi:hypothetical protein